MSACQENLKHNLIQISVEKIDCVLIHDKIVHGCDNLLETECRRRGWRRWWRRATGLNGLDSLRRLFAVWLLGSERCC